jgi:long-chain acyl-CoA synthetase
MSWRWTPEECEYVVGNCEADCLVADARFAAAARAAAPHVPPERRFAVGGEIEGFRSWSETERFASSPLEAPLCGDVMMYTSGTTGRPKGVQRESFPEGPPPTLIAKAGMAMFQAFLPPSAPAGAATMRSDPERVHPGAHLVCAPLYHSGPNTYCDGALMLGADVVLLDRFDAEEVLATIQAHRVMSTFMVPTHFVRLLRLPEATRARYDLSSLRLVMHGAAPVAPDVKRKMIDWLGPILFEFYGGTEGGGCMISSQEWLERPGSVGRPRPGLSLKILDEEGREVPPRTEGGVYFPLSESPFVYKDDPEKTLGSRRDGLFTMGDIGYVDEDGYLFLCDRSADVIISGGVNVYPAQIEAALLELPFVADACVIGVPNEEWGEEVRALVELVAGPDAPAESEARAAIDAHCRRRLAGYEVPRAVEFRDALPRTETGKLARRRLRAPYWEGRGRRV